MPARGGAVTRAAGIVDVVEDDDAVTSGAPAVRFEVVAYDGPDAARFTAAAQRFYVERYGGADRTPVDPAEFAPPRGLFLVGREVGREHGREHGAAVCCGGWRRHDAGTIAARDRGVLQPGDAELKRMWVEPARRRRGLARRVLAELERTAAAAGCLRTVLETGVRQPESLALYRVAGYRPIDRFGVYRDDADSLCFARDLTPPTRGAPAGTG